MKHIGARPGNAGGGGNTAAAGPHRNGQPRGGCHDACETIVANQYETLGQVLVVGLEGAFNSANAAQIEAGIMRELDQGTNQLLLDLSALDYISSAGLRVVLVAAKRLKQSAGLLVLCGIHSQIREVFEISGFLHILNVADTRAQALERFNEVA